MRREKRNEMECEEGRKIESNSEVDRDRDRLSKGVECESEKNAKMHVTGVQRVAIRRGPNEPRGVGYVSRRKEKASKEEQRPIREDEGRGERREAREERRDESDERGRRLREYRAKCKAREREGTREVKKREGAREREAERDIEWKCARERERERAREDESGRTRKRERERERGRRRAAACSAEGARRPHMCSETNVRSECRLLPIIRCRGVPLCARGWSADSVPRFYAAR